MTAPAPPSTRPPAVPGQPGPGRPGPGAAPPPPAAPGPRDPATRPGSRGAGVTRLVLVELVVLVAVLGVLRGSVPLLAGAAAGAVVVGLAAFLRTGGRWWYETVADRLRLRRRGRVAAGVLATATPGSSARDVRVSAALSPLARAFAIHGYDDRGATLGIGQDQAGFFSGLMVLGEPASAGRTLPAGALARLVAEGTAPLSALQVTTLRVSAPSPWLPGDAPAAQSYRMLAGKLLEGPPGPSVQQVWLTVRLGVADVGEAAESRGGGVDGVRRAMAAALNRVGGVLSTAEVPYEALGPDQLRDAILSATGLDRPGQQPATETWTGWYASGLAHVTYEVSRWPGPPAPELLADLAHTPATRVLTSVVLRRVGDRAGIRALVRLAAPPEQLAALVRTLQDRAARAGVGLRRVDGRHGPAVYATSPTGGGIG